MYRTDFWTLWKKARVGCFKRTAWKHVYYLGWNRSPAQVGCMRQALRPGALGRPRGTGWRGRWEGGSGWGTHVNPWLIHFNVWQNPLKYCKVISLQLIKKIKKKKWRKDMNKIINTTNIKLCENFQKKISYLNAVVLLRAFKENVPLCPDNVNFILGNQKVRNSVLFCFLIFSHFILRVKLINSD